METARESLRSLDNWRKFFRCCEADVFEVMERAMEVAAADHPHEFAARRDGIAQRLFTCHQPRRKPSSEAPSKETTAEKKKHHQRSISERLFTCLMPSCSSDGSDSGEEEEEEVERGWGTTRKLCGGEASETEEEAMGVVKERKACHTEEEEESGNRGGGGMSNSKGFGKEALPSSKVEAEKTTTTTSETLRQPTPTPRAFKIQPLLSSAPGRIIRFRIVRQAEGEAPVVAADARRPCTTGKEEASGKKMPPLPPPATMPDREGESAMKAKFEATRKRLREGYEQAAAAKRSRAVRVLKKPILTNSIGRGKCIRL